MSDTFKRLAGFHQKVTNDVPQLKRGMVWCAKCGASQKVDAVQCLAHGWPKCCGYTMTIDSPAERRSRTPTEKEHRALR